MLLQRRKLAVILGLCILIFVLTSCKEKESPGVKANDAALETSPQASDEPVTLSFFRDSAALPEDEFNTLVKEPLKKKFPNITLNYSTASKDLKLEQLVAAGGDLPDIVFGSNPRIPAYKQLKMADDLNNLIKSHKLDLSLYNPALVDSLHKYGDNGQLYALPFAENLSALFVNKDIFEKFGVPLPTDSMSWDDIVTLASRLTRTDSGINYKGFDPIDLLFIGQGLSLPIIDAKTNQPLLESDGWKKVLSLGQRFLDIPGYMEGDKYKFGRGVFLNDRNIAMIPDFVVGVVPELEKLGNQGKPMNWEYYGMPSFKEAPGKSRATDIHLLILNPQSKAKDQAFQVMQFISSSMDVQKLVNSTGRLTPLKDPQLRETLGHNFETMKGKNTAGVLKSTPTVIAQPTAYDDIIIAELHAATDDMAKHVDINTALRQANERAKKKIAEEQSK